MKPPAIAAALMLLALLSSACTTTRSVGTGSIIAPVRFVDAGGATVSVPQRAGRLTALLGGISGSIYGKPAPYQSEPIDPGASSTAVNLTRFNDVIIRLSAPITSEAKTSGWSITPADTHFVRLATSLRSEYSLPGGTQIGLTDADSNRTLLLVFFDRPCRLTGTVVSNTSFDGIAKHVVDVTIREAGWNWLEVVDNHGHDQKLIRGARKEPKPVFVVHLQGTR